MREIFIPILLVIFSLTLSACGTTEKKEVVVKEKNQESKIIPKYNISGDYYRTIIPLNKQVLGGEVNQKTNSKIDVTRFEEGLFNIALKKYDKASHFLQRSEYIPQKEIQELLKKQEVPYVSNVIEHDYFTKKDSNGLQLEGVIIGLAMTSDHSNEEAVVTATEFSNNLLQLIYNNKKFKNVPITFALFKQEALTSTKSGTFISRTTVPKDQKNLGEWTTINEKSFMYPSPDFQSTHTDDYKKLDDFTHSIKKFNLKDYYSINAFAIYKDNQLDKLTINTSIQYNGKSELISFTQMATQFILDIFPEYPNIRMIIKSDNQTEVVIIKEKNQAEPFVSFL
ncbi:sex pheromone [Bacillus clarus]|uniref:Sex pheromone n=1 Tax=Bacillus clarus TaxID=2338372 RepID=A0A090YSQ6_9BACI|nr:CamS family sex pheromone protein [Bacillus clarus]KFM95105.1 camS sex pheromone cAM373 family protein [Bacillus clarus]RFT62937.1 sex pheromone [Bacillus clarus]